SAVNMTLSSVVPACWLAPRQAAPAVHEFPAPASSTIRSRSAVRPVIVTVNGPAPEGVNRWANSGPLVPEAQAPPGPQALMSLVAPLASLALLVVVVTHERLLLPFLHTGAGQSPLRLMW